jgi:hypothetical protein
MFPNTLPPSSGRKKKKALSSETFLFSYLRQQYTECGISQLTAAHFVGGHILGN